MLRLGASLLRRRREKIMNPAPLAPIWLRTRPSPGAKELGKTTVHRKNVAPSETCVAPSETCGNSSNDLHSDTEWTRGPPSFIGRRMVVQSVVPLDARRVVLLNVILDRRDQLGSVRDSRELRRIVSSAASWHPSGEGRARRTVPRRCSVET